jgi:hypothetical protein
LEKSQGQGFEDDEVERDLAGSENLTGDEGGFDDDDDIGDRMSSSPSIADEDIDFEMVYALHTFTATVEGQANATKGEHMVLLDDSNSYWWLVRIVRDSSIGYLPAEHIETPTERLARLNKHRNIDLASNMLSDTAHEKTKNPLKKAMRRRNTKTVTFTAPTYVEASDYDYSTDEEGENGYETNDEDEGSGGRESQTKEAEATEGAGKSTVKPTISLDDKPKTSISIVEVKTAGDENVKLRQNPTPSSLRHPDSAVFSDDKAETKKITLTPNLLRDDGIDGPTASLKGRGSLDKDKSGGRDNGIISPEPRGKDGRRMRKGAGGVLGSLFKRRNKKGKNDEADLEDWLHSGHGQGQEKQSSISSRESEDSQIDVKREKGDAQKRQQEQQIQQQQQQKDQQKPVTVASVSSTIRKVEPESEVKEEVAVHGPTLQQKQSFEMQRSGSGTKPTAVYSPDKRSLSNSSRSSETERGPLQQEKSQHLTVNSPVETNPSEPPAPQREQPQLRQLSTENNSNSSSNNSPSKPAYQKSTYQPFRANPSPEQPPPQTPIERLSESPEQISYHDATDQPDLIDTTSSGDDTSSSPVESLLEIIERTADPSPAPIVAAEENAITRTWSDWSLRTYFEDDNDVRDMLIVVQQDKSGGSVVRKDHPDIGPLFEDASTRLADITKRLDGVLGDWLQRKVRTR